MSSEIDSTMTIAVRAAPSISFSHYARSQVQLECQLAEKKKAAGFLLYHFNTFTTATLLHTAEYFMFFIHTGCFCKDIHFIFTNPFFWKGNPFLDEGNPFFQKTWPSCLKTL